MNGCGRHFLLAPWVSGGVVESKSLQIGKDLAAPDHFFDVACHGQARSLAPLPLAGLQVPRSAFGGRKTFSRNVHLFPGKSH